MRKYYINATLHRNIEQLYDKATSAVQMKSSKGERFKIVQLVLGEDIVCHQPSSAPLERSMSDVQEEHDIEDLTRVVISYEIDETSIRRVSSISYEMTTWVRFCLSYDPLKWDFIAFKMNII